MVMKSKSRLTEFFLKLLGLSGASLVYNEVTRHKRYLDLSNQEPYKYFVGKKYYLKVDCFYDISSDEIPVLKLLKTSESDNALSESTLFVVKGFHSKIINEQLLLYSHDMLIEVHSEDKLFIFIANELTESTVEDGHYEFIGLNPQYVDNL